MKIKVEKLSIYPVKSCGGMSVSEFTMSEQGPQIQIGNQMRGDRQWMWVSPSGVLLTQREIPQLSLVHPVFQEGRFLFQFPGGEIAVTPSNERKNVHVWTTEIDAKLWQISNPSLIHQYLGKEAHLVEFDLSSKREATRKGEGLGVQTRFTDSQPYLIVNQESLQDLNSRMKDSIPMSRFRANIEVSGAPAFAEDQWQSLHKPGVELKCSKACGRCVMININQENQTDKVEKNPEALKTLAQFRRQDKAVFFGQYFHTFSFGQKLKVGDELEISLG